MIRHNLYYAVDNPTDPPSVLATDGLFAFARPIEQRLTRRGPLSWPFLRWAVEPLTATLAASLFSLPILLYHVGRLSLIAPLANIVMLWAVPSQGITEVQLIQAV